MWFLLGHQYKHALFLGLSLGNNEGYRHGDAALQHVGRLYVTPLVERALVPRLWDYGIKLRARYRDDILLIATCKKVFGYFLQKYWEGARSYQANVEKYLRRGKTNVAELSTLRDAPRYVVKHV